MPGTAIAGVAKQEGCRYVFSKMLRHGHPYFSSAVAFDMHYGMLHAGMLSDLPASGDGDEQRGSIPH